MRYILFNKVISDSVSDNKEILKVITFTHYRLITFVKYDGICILVILYYKMVIVQIGFQWFCCILPFIIYQCHVNSLGRAEYAHWCLNLSTGRKHCANKFDICCRCVSIAKCCSVVTVYFGHR